jgi:hypothetical protein
MLPVMTVVDEVDEDEVVLSGGGANDPMLDEVVLVVLSGVQAQNPLHLVKLDVVAIVPVPTWLGVEATAPRTHGLEAGQFVVVVAVVSEELLLSGGIWMDPGSGVTVVPPQPEAPDASAPTVATARRRKRRFDVRRLILKYFLNFPFGTARRHGASRRHSTRVGERSEHMPSPEHSDGAQVQCAMAVDPGAVAHADGNIAQ